MPLLPDLILENAHVLTLNPELPIARYVAIKGANIVSVGDRSEERSSKYAGVKRIDCQGMTLIPGFNDAHIHLLAFASATKKVDCRPKSVWTIDQIVESIRLQAEKTPRGRLIQAYGYDEFYIEEKRHPNRYDLDRATATHPVRLDHRTGHATVINTLALSLLGIGEQTPDPVDGVVERDEVSRVPTGLLFEMSKYLQQLRQQGPRGDELTRGIRQANALLLSKGITSIQDATPANDLSRWQVIKRLKEDSHLTPRVSMMVGSSSLNSFLEEGQVPGTGNASIALGAVKVVLSLTTGSLLPCTEELSQLVSQVHLGGFQIAIHAVEQDAVEAAADALLTAQQTRPRPHARHRIEHCSECPPLLARKIANSRSLVATQPSFIYRYGDKYLSQTPPVLAPHLYPLKSLNMAGVPLTASSDAPVDDPDPIISIYSAITRKMANGKVFPGANQLSAYDALRMHNLGGAYASFQEGSRGSIESGKLADLVLLTKDPTSIEPEEIKDIQVALTMVGGKIAWES